MLGVNDYEYATCEWDVVHCIVYVMMISDRHHRLSHCWVGLLSVCVSWVAD